MKDGEMITERKWRQGEKQQNNSTVLNLNCDTNEG